MHVNLQVLVAAVPLEEAVEEAREVWRSLAEVEGPAEPAEAAADAHPAVVSGFGTALEPAGPAGRGSRGTSPPAEPAEPGKPAAAAEPAATAEEAAPTATDEGGTVPAALPAQPAARAEADQAAGEATAAAPQAGGSRASMPQAAEPMQEGATAVGEEGFVPAVQQEGAVEPGAALPAEAPLPATAGMPVEQRKAAALPQPAAAEAARPALQSVPGGSIPAEEEQHPFKLAPIPAGPAEAAVPAEAAAPEAPATPAAAASGLPAAPAFPPALNSSAARPGAVTVQRLGGSATEGSPKAGKGHSFLGRLLHTA